MPLKSNDIHDMHWFELKAKHVLQGPIELNKTTQYNTYDT